MPPPRRVTTVTAMRRFPAALAAALTVVALAACSAAPPEFDPATGDGYEELVAGFAELSPEQQLDELAAHDAVVEREQWTGELEDELGGPEATDEVFAGLVAQLQDSVGVAQADDTPYTLASYTTSNVGEASGAGMFAGMLFSSLMSEAGIAATQYGATGDVVKDFGEHGNLTVSAGEDGVVTTGYEVSTTYKGVKMTIVVGNSMNPCPDENGVVDASGKYQINVEGPNGAGSSTQIDLEMTIQVDDDAKIASSDYTYEATYMKRPQAADAAIFDLTTESLSFRAGSKGGWERTDLSIAGFWSKTFETEAAFMSALQAAWVASSLEKAAARGWQDGRCISLTASYSAGPTGLKPNSEVTITAKPVAKKDGKPAGGTVTAELTGGAESVTPSGTKVKADAKFTYTAPDKKDQTGTVHFESRSKRGVGKLDATLDTKDLRAYSAVGGGGDFQGSGIVCDITKPFTISGSGVTMQFTPTGVAGGTYSYSGSISGFAVSGGESYEVTSVDGVATSIRGYGVGSVETPIGTQSGYGEENYTLTPLEGTPEGC